MLMLRVRKQLLMLTYRWLIHCQLVIQFQPGTVTQINILTKDNSDDIQRLCFYNVNYYVLIIHLQLLC